MPKIQFFNNVGKPLAGGKLYTCNPGTTCGPTTTTDLKDTYTDSSGETPNANPVVLDSAGRANIWVLGYYKVALYTSTGVLVYTQDNVFAGTPTGSSTEVDVLDTYGGGSSYNSTTINAAIAAAGSTPTTFYLKPGTWTMNANITVPSTISLHCPIGVNIITTGFVFTSAGPIDAGPYQIFGGFGTLALSKYPQEAAWTGNTEKITMVDLDLTSVDITRMKQLAAMYRPHSQVTPNMTVLVSAGSFVLEGTVITNTEQTTETIVAPESLTRLDLIQQDYTTGAISVVTGTPGGALPACTNHLYSPIAKITVVPGQTSINNSSITDLRMIPRYPIDPIPTTAGLRTIGTGAWQAASGADSRFYSNSLYSLIPAAGVSVPLIYSLTNRNVSPANNTPYTKIKDVVISVPIADTGTATGAVTVYYEMAVNSTTDFSRTSYSRVYKNGTAVGTEHSITTTATAMTAYTGYYENFTIAAGDHIQIYIKGPDIQNLHYIYIQNLRVTCNDARRGAVVMD
jgi:hypothetical protein